MADPRSSLHWLKKDLPQLEAAVRAVEKHKPTSKKRISAERKLKAHLQRMAIVEARIQTMEDSLPPPPSTLTTDVDQTHDDGESALTNPEDTTETVVPSDMNSKTVDSTSVSDKSEAADLTTTDDAPPSHSAEQTTPGASATFFTSTDISKDVDPTTDDASANLSDEQTIPEQTISSDPLHSFEEPTTPKATDTNQMGSSGLDDNKGVVHNFTPLELSELEEMYSDESGNDYDIDEYVEKFSTDDDVYDEYAANFDCQPGLNAPEIRLKVLHALPSFGDLSVKTVTSLRWDQLQTSDKICLSILGRVAIRRFVEAYKTDQNATLSPNWVKVFARNEPRFLPEAGTTSAPVALAFLRMQNLPEIRCRFHHSERHDERHAADTPNYLTGCAFPPPDTGEKKPKGTGKGKGKGKKPIEAGPAREVGHLDCGCSLVDALEDWFHYKTARLVSSNPRISKTFTIQGVISPLERASLLTALRSPIRIPLRLRYTGVNRWPELAGQWMTGSYELDLLRKTRALISVQIQQLERGSLSVPGAREAVAGKRTHESTDLGGAGNQMKKLKAE